MFADGADIPTFVVDKLQAFSQATANRSSMKTASPSPSQEFSNEPEDNVDDDLEVR